MDQASILPTLIRQRRLELGWSQTEAARRAGLPVRIWFELEARVPKRLPRLEVARVVADALGMPLTDLYEAAGLHLRDDQPAAVAS